MMNVARVVIGANYGDEGKGLTTDYLVDKHHSDLVVRFNGGAQAGHTVITPDGRRYVFGHFGAGSFAGAATLLSRFFLVNPIVFATDYIELSSMLPSCIDVKVDFNAPVTTMFDMILNQMVETKRGNNRHGSCGMGVNETIERNERFHVKLTAKDLTNSNDLRQILIKIRNEWIPLRKQELDLDDSHDHILFSESFIERFIDDAAFMAKTVEFVNDVDVIRNSKNPVFEGAQGLLLDQSHRFFPYVTRSNTGIKNAIELISDSGINYVEAYYITRSYLTRHGAGPLFNEIPEKVYTNIVDDTNIPNDWQGSLRFAYLDLDLLKESIENDLTNTAKFQIEPILVITCLDQVSQDTFKVRENGDLNSVDSAIGEYIANKLNFKKRLESFGPTRDTIVEV